jgi:hypothetical protein
MIIFQNHGLIDLRAITVMGINAKVSKNPIGQFGTGLKYSIAVLLRSGCKISLFIGENEWTFTTQKDSFRSKEFDMVRVHGPQGQTMQLPFTLELGKHWEPWMAIRELESNCRDEGGTSWANADYQLSADITTIVISGTTADHEYSKLSNIFIKSEALWKNDVLEVYPIENPEQQGWVYYRGVRCGTVAKPVAYRYNLLQAKTLTEDRTFKYSWSATEDLAELRKCTNREIIRTIVDSRRKDTTEGDINYTQYNLSDEFIDEVTTLGIRATHSAWRAVRMAKGYSEYEEVEPDALQRAAIAKAQAFIRAMGETRIGNFPVHLSPDLGPKVLGRAENGQIWLTLRVFEMGMKQVVSTMYEEYIHLDRKYSDLDYEMQNFLFDTIITQAAKLQGEIL